jgi:uncharacterized membrane protein YozB (DUF420 family)/cytochrome oxidase Cu insertion factor (SCO1/SenC/PrrC family)
VDVVETQMVAKSAPARPTLAGAFAFPALAILVALGSALAKTPPRPLGKVAPFTLTERSGRAFSRAELDGHPWVADFVFTRCGGPCPLVSNVMEKVQASLGRSDARLVTFTVDPTHDTPTVLSEYATLHHAEDRWSFLTGDEAAIANLVSASFHLPMSRDPGAPVGQLVTHSTRLVLVDREGQIRGYYDGVDENMQPSPELEGLLHDLRALGSGSRLPLLNASLNATSALLLILGFVFIRSGRTGAHVTCMLGALAVSAAFLGSYLYYHAFYPDTPFTSVDAGGRSKLLYLLVLVPHVLLAVPVVPLALGTAAFGLRGKFERHRVLARWTFPLWIYVCVTGVAVYVLLYAI